jgi:prolyl oligopeptidase
MKTMKLCLAGLAICASMKGQMVNLKYPVTKQCDTVDTYFGTKVADPYRWLENDRSEETAAWVKAQNAVTQSYLSTISFRNEMKVAFTTMWNYPKMGLPQKQGSVYFLSRNSGIQNQSVIYAQNIKTGKELLFLDPNTLSKDGTMALNGFSVSHDNRYVAYQLATGGSDWNEIRLKSIDGADLKDVVKWVKFSGIGWYKNGFFYSRYDAPGEHALSTKNEYHKIYYHVVGTSQAEDNLIYQDKSHANMNFEAAVTEDEHFLVINGSQGTSGNNVLIADLSKGVNTKFRTVISSFENDVVLIENIGNNIYLKTNAKAPNAKVIKYDFATQTFTDVIPEREEVLESATIIGGKLIILSLHNAYSRLSVYSVDGKCEKQIPLPEIGTVNGISGKKNEAELFYSFTSFTCAGNIYRLNVNTLQSQLYHATQLPFATDDLVTEQLFYPSKDGTQVPMFIVHKKGLKLDGNNPLLLYGYGGFDISLTPAFAISRMLFLKNGGIWVTANLRGGGEFGKKWHEAGTKMQKQNVFDDFIAAAEYLIQQKYTSSQKLAIQGASNGGLLVGACMTQRPELFKVAIPQVGVMDMLRYHKFTIGWAWASDYGTSADNEAQFRYLYRYSPLHSIKKGVTYPATLCTTADHDDRVVPAHTFKFISTLQANNSGANPTLVRIETMAGHGAGKPTGKAIQEQTDIWSFVFYNLNMDFKNPVGK